MLIALGNASLARGKEVEFIDHCGKQSYLTALCHALQIRILIKTIRLKASVRVEGTRVFVKSEVK
jgi:hypothetical protein